MLAEIAHEVETYARRLGVSAAITAGEAFLPYPTPVGGTYTASVVAHLEHHALVCLTLVFARCAEVDTAGTVSAAVPHRIVDKLAQNEHDPLGVGKNRDTLESLHADRHVRAHKRRRSGFQRIAHES